MTIQLVLSIDLLTSVRWLFIIEGSITVFVSICAS